MRVGEGRADGHGEAGPVDGASVGAAIGFIPARSADLTRIATAVMISPSSAIPAETRYPLAKPVENAWSVMALVAAAC